MDKSRVTSDAVNAGTTIHLLGPTTTGKTAIAVELVNHFPIEVVNSDKFHCYRGFELGTGASDLPEEKGIRTHLFRFLEPESPMLSVREYVDRALNSIQEIHDRGHVAVIDGSSFSFNAAFFKLLSGQSSNMKYVALAVRWRSASAQLSAVRTRLSRAFGDALVDEASHAADAGLLHSYVMQKGVVYRQLMPMICDGISPQDVVQEIEQGILEIAASQLARYDGLALPTWIERDLYDMDAVIDLVKHEVEAVKLPRRAPASVERT